MREILLDTNAVIALSDPTHCLFQLIEEVLAQGGRASACVIAWHEYMRGPLTMEDRERALGVIESRIIPLDRPCAEFGAQLYNQTGRRRGSTADCLIASVAIRHNFELVTWNHEDFERFVPMGLSLVR
jgi:predicted nucleic acid-binding protein